MTGGTLEPKCVPPLSLIAVLSRARKDFLPWNLWIRHSRAA